MMRLDTISYERRDRKEKIEFSNGKELTSGNFITVVNGENGTGKSALLRAISDLSLGRSESRQRGGVFKNVDGKFIDGLPSSTIALSGTINDRFPVTAGGDLRLSLRSFDLDKFRYFGPKYASGIASYNRASSNITRAVLSGMQFGWDFGPGLSYLMDYLGVKPVVQIGFERNDRRLKDESSYLSNLQSVLRKALDEKKDAPRHVRDAFFVLEALVPSESQSFTAPNRLRVPPQVLQVNIATGEFTAGVEISKNLLGDAQFGSLDEATILSACLSIGLLSSTVSFQSVNRDEFVEIDQMSSGQWQLLNCMFNLCAHLKDETLVLIDEPENSLHPQWQRNYIDLVRRLTAHRIGCHIIIATHSPLLVSSLLPEEGNVIRLDRSSETQALQVTAEETAYGWIPGDVLRERFELPSERAPEFAKAVNSALQIMRRPGEQMQELKVIARKLSIMRSHLPQYDTIRNVLDVIIDAAEISSTDSES